MISEYGLGKKFDITLEASVEQYLKVPELLEGMEIVFLRGIRSHEWNLILKRCIWDRIEIYMIPRIGDMIMSGAKQMQIHMMQLPNLNVGWQNLPAEYLIAKKAMNIVIAGVLRL